MNNINADRESERLCGRETGASHTRTSPHTSNYNEHKQLLIPIEVEEIHKNLKKAVSLFSYWARNIDTYIRNSQRLDELKQGLYFKQKLIDERSLKSQTRVSTQEQTKASLVKELSEKIDKFNKGYKQSLVIKEFFKMWQMENKSTSLRLDHFKDITEININSISDSIKTKLVTTQQKTKARNNTKSPNNISGVTLSTFERNIKCLTSDIKSYQASVKSDDDIRIEIDSKKKEIEELICQMKEIEYFQFNVESNNDDSTNFVAAEMGFLTEVQADCDYESHIEYYHYPITFTNKNTFSIYDLQNEEFNYFFGKSKRLLYGNYIVDNAIIKHTTRNCRSQADPINDYHSESVLFFLCQQRSFQEKMIKKLIKDLHKEGLKMTKLEKLILEIHSTNDICVQCFQKAKYLINWKEENTKLIQEKQGSHFLEYFRQTLTKMLKKDECLDQKSVLDLEIEIRISYDEAYSKGSTESNPCIIRFENNDNDLLVSDRALSKLYKYSIITSGGVANVHNNYSYAYNKAVEPTRKHAIKKIIKAWKAWCERKKFNNDIQVDLSSLIKKNPEKMMCRSDCGGTWHCEEDKGKRARGITEKNIMAKRMTSIIRWFLAVKTQRNSILPAPRVSLSKDAESYTTSKQ